MKSDQGSDDINMDQWILRFESGDETAEAELFNVFYDRLVRLARRRLVGMPPQVADDEGAAISALRSFFSGIEHGQFPRLNDQDDLWKLLATITARKAIRQQRAFWKQSGESGRVKRNRDLRELFSREPPAAAEAEMIEEIDQHLASLENQTLRDIVRLKLEGWSSEEIAEKLDIHIRSVQRKLKLVESRWLHDADEP